MIPQVLRCICYFRESDETDSASRRLGREALKLYFDRTLPDLATNDGIHRLSQMMGDPTFNIIGTMTARQMAKNTPQPVYEYLYTHEGTLSLTDILIGGMGTFLLRVLQKKTNETKSSSSV